MWAQRIESLRDRRGRHASLFRNGEPATVRQILRACQDDEAFRTFFLDLLADAPFAGFRWETPTLKRTTFDRPFECVLLDEPGLDCTADPAAFADHFAAPSEGGATVLAFPNLSRDAVLVVPRPIGPTDAYGHLAAFVRRAPDAQRHDLWRVVGATVEARIGDQPIWLSTAGMGVPWIHVRIDNRPKYYGHAPYRRP